MRDINKAILLGRLGADPILRYTKSGIAVCQFSIATTRRFIRSRAFENELPPTEANESAATAPAMGVTETPVEGESVMRRGVMSGDSDAPGDSDPVDGAQMEMDPTEMKEDTQWHRIVTWGRQAQACAQYLKKGNAVYVEGWMRVQRYADKLGQRRYYSEIQSEIISFL